MSEWVKSYLNERYPLVHTASSLLNPALIKSKDWCASRTDLGPTLGLNLFLTFINNLSSYVASSKPFVFANDSTLMSSRTEINELSASLKTDIQYQQSLVRLTIIKCNLIQKRWNNGAKLVLEQSTKVPSIVLFRKLNWIPIFNLIKIRKVLVVFNTLKRTLAPEIFHDSHLISTRSSILDLKLLSVKTMQTKSKIA